MNDIIIIAGVNINDLKKQRDALKKDANKFVSDNIEQVTKLVNQIVEAESEEEAEKLGKEAFELLEAAELVASVSGVTFLLPYYEEYGRYDSDEVLSMKLENSENENLDDVYNSRTYLGKLYDLLGNMEADSLGWYSSRC